MLRYVVLCLAVLGFSSAAEAQATTNLTDPLYLAVLTNNPVAPGACNPAPGGYCLNLLEGIPLSYFETAASANAVSQVNNAFNALNGEINAMNMRVLQLAAISASMGDAIPSPGDRFALRLNVAGFEGGTGGSLGFSYAPTSSLRFSLNYGQGSAMSVVSGGVNLSFH